MKFRKSIRYFAAGIALATLLGPTVAAAGPDQAMMKPTPQAGKDWRIRPVLTIGQSIGGYTPPGVLDGLGAYKLNGQTVRVLANHELGLTDGYGFTVKGPANQSVPVASGARISYFDFDRSNVTIKNAGLAIKRIYNRDQKLISDMSNFDGTERSTFSRFCSSSLYEPLQFGGQRGVAQRVYITGEEDGGAFNNYGGGQWALDPQSGDFWAVPAMGRGGWENVAQIDSGRQNTVAFIMADDTAPFVIDADPNGSEGDIPFNTDPKRNNQNDGSPLYLYVGKKAQSGDFLDVNGLKDGSLYVFVAAATAQSIRTFNGTGNALNGHFEKLVNSGPELDKVCPSGRPSDPFGPVTPSGKHFGPNKDGFGYATQRCLWFQARTIHKAFQFSRPEDVSINPQKGNEVTFASTGREGEFGNVDQWGTLYAMTVHFALDGAILGRLRVLYDADDVIKNRELGLPSRDFGLRSVDNLDWLADGTILAQEDAAVEAFGTVSKREASIWRFQPEQRKLTRIAEMDRSVVLDPSAKRPAFDQDAGQIGAWESSGILDVSKLFGRPDSSLMLFDVQAHGITDQTEKNPGSRISDTDLKEGGQLLLLRKKTP